MKTFDQLEAVTSLENNALLVANNANNTATNKISFINLKTQILNDVPTDHYESSTVVAATDSGQSDAEATNGNVHLNHIENNSVKSSHTISGSGATTVTSNSSGDITISSTDTDTHYTSSTIIGASASATSNAAAINDSVYVNHIENSAVVSSHKIAGSGATTVTSNANGDITISSTDTWTAFVGATSEDAGTAGYVPAPTTSDINKFFKADGTWADPTSALGTAASKDYTDTYDSNGDDVTTGKAVAAALATLPEPMVFKGSLGTGGTITTLPAAASSGASKNTGFTYKVIEDGTYQSISAKVGDTFISTGSAWVLIPSGDEPSGTVSSVGITQGDGISVSGGPITSSGSITVSHADTSTQSSVTNNGRTYIQSVTLDGMGHVTAISSATETVTDTHYASSTVIANTSAGTSNAVATNGNVYLNHIENNALVSSHKIVGSGATTVTSDANGDITINSAEFPSDIECGFES